MRDSWLVTLPSKSSAQPKTRPSLYLSDFICAQCGKQPDMVTYSRSATSFPASKNKGPYKTGDRINGVMVFDCGEGYLSGEITCHGETTQYIATFDEVRALQKSKTPMMVFESIALLEDGLKAIEDGGSSERMPALPRSDEPSPPLQL